MAAEYRFQHPQAGSFAAFYREWRDFVMCEAFFVCGSEPDAEDVVQLVFLRLWESKTWTDIRNPRSYLRGAGRREARRLGQGPVGLPEGWDVADPAGRPIPARRRCGKAPSGLRGPEITSAQVPPRNDPHHSTWLLCRRDSH
ncbi:RNA polymerase sigma factor [Gaopeijia maritima]|uniref:RNA polymerase sigma factor n=1 Tax=Gaopeijia maritima TaxID=3119007 RepID=UPI00386EFE6A